MLLHTGELVSLKTTGPLVWLSPRLAAQAGTFTFLSLGHGQKREVCHAVDRRIPGRE